MSNAQRRLDRLFPALTARERGILALQAVKEGREQDPRVTSTLPREQVREFMHYVFVINSLSSELGTHLALISHLVGQLHLGLGWLETIKLWGMTVLALAQYIVLHTKEPVTQNEYEQLVRKERERLVPASHLAERLVEQHGGWTDSNRKGGGGADDKGQVTDAAWERLFREKEGEIARLVEEGVLVGKRKGQRLLVTEGSFQDRLGKPTRVLPDLGSGHEVFPDEKAELVGFLQLERRHAQEMLEAAPRGFMLDSPAARAARISEGAKKVPTGGDDVADSLLASLLEGVQLRHRELRAAEIVIQEMAAEFDGLDPLTQMTRHILETTRRSLEEARSGLEGYIGEFEMPEPGENDLERVRTILGRAEKVYT